jgi:hypothetical protein
MKNISRGLFVTFAIAICGKTFGSEPTFTGPSIDFNGPPKVVSASSLRPNNKRGDAKDSWLVDAQNPNRLNYSLTQPNKSLHLTVDVNLTTFHYDLSFDGMRLSEHGVDDLPASSDQPPVPIKNQTTTAQAPPAANVAPVNFGISGSGTPTAAAAAKAAGIPGETGNIKSYVISLAREWNTTGQGRRQFVQKYDKTPVNTCENLVRIFESTANAITDKADLTTLEADLKRNVNNFYESVREGRTTMSAAQEDWQPFLKKIEADIPVRFPAVALSDPLKAKFALIEVAEAFQELRAHFLGERPPTTSGSGNFGNDSEEGGDGTSDSCRHCRKRGCRCGRLLFIR